MSPFEPQPEAPVRQSARLDADARRPIQADAPGRLRLQTVAACVPAGSRVADIGSDHGLLPRLLLDTGRSPGCIATERRPGGPLADLHGRDPRLRVRYGDGLAALEPGDTADVLTICGLGTRTMLRIFAADRLRLKQFPLLVLQPQSQWARLRRFLSDAGYGLIDERMVCDRDRFYLILVAASCIATGRTPLARPAHPYRTVADSDPGLTPDDRFEAGPLLITRRCPVSARYWREQLEWLRREHLGAAPDWAGRLTDRIRQVERILAALAR